MVEERLNVWKRQFVRGECSLQVERETEERGMWNLNSIILGHSVDLVCTPIMEWTVEQGF